MLKMKCQCEKCNADTGERELAYICSYECTFCAGCASAMDHVCPNCAGELLARPRRMKKPLEVAAKQLKGMLLGK
jgi:hypothetical protein